MKQAQGKGKKMDRGTESSRRITRRRFLGLTVAGASATLLGGCGGASDNGGDGGYEIGLVVARTGDPVFAMMECGAREASQALGAKLTIDGPPEWDPTKQIPVLNAMIARRPDAIVIDPTDETALVEPLRRAVDSGVRVVTVDSDLGGDLNLPHIGTDGVAGGSTAAKKLFGLMGKKGKVLVVGVAPGITITDQRHKGFLEVLKEYPEIEFFGKQYAGDSPDKVATIIKGTLQKHPDLAGIHADATLIGEFTGAALRNVGRKDIPAVSFDASPTEVEWLKENYLDGLLPFDPSLLGKMGVETAIKQIEGEKVEQNVLTDYTYVTRENMDQPNIKSKLYRFQCA